MLRFAPRSSNDMDLQDLRIAILNHIVSKQRDKDIMICINDADSSKGILEMLNLFTIEYRHVMNQKDNLKYHRQIAMQMLVDKKAFNCFCSDEALQKDKEKLASQGKPYQYSGFCDTLSDETTINLDAPFCVRIKKPNTSIAFKDSFQGDLEYSPDQIDSFIILNHDKSSTNNFAQAIDDMLGNISIVIQTEESLDDTPRQIYLREQIGYTQAIEYITIPSIQNTQDIDLKTLIDDGFLPAAIANYLITLGYETPKEIFSLEEAATWFDITKLSKQEVVFVMEDLEQINQSHIQTLDNMRLSKIIGYADDDIGALAKLFLDNCFTLQELKEKINLIFNPKKQNNQYTNHIDTIKKVLQTAPFIDQFDDFNQYLLDQSGLDQETLSNTLKIILCGSTNGPDLKKVYPLIKNYLGEII